MADDWSAFPEAAPAQDATGWESFPEAPAEQPKLNHVFTRAPGGGTSQVNTPQESFLDSTSVGRVLDAFGQGAKNGWGAEPLGLSDESVKALRDGGWFNDFENGRINLGKGFNEALLRPAAAGLDAVLRAFPAVNAGVAEAIGQTVQEGGMTSTNANRLTRDLYMMGEMAGVAAGEPAYMGTSAKPTRSVVFRESAAEAPKPIVAGEPAPPGLAEVPGYKPALPVEGAQLDLPLAPAVMNADAAPAAVLKSEPVTSPVQTIPPAVDKAGNINLNRIQAPADVKQLIRETAQANDDFDSARRSVVPWAETERNAAALGMTPSELLKRNIGQAFNDAEIEAARNLMVQSAVSVREAAARSRASGSEADLLKFQDALATHTLIQEQVSGAAAEAGRALNVFKKITKTDTELGDVMTAAGGRETLETLARQINELDTPQKVSKFIREAQKASTVEQIVEAWKAGLLTNPVTHSRNILGNLAVSVWRTAETGVAATIGGVRRLAGTTDESVLFGEVGGRVTGMAQGAIEGILGAGKAFKLGAPLDDALHGTVDARNMRAIPGPIGEGIRTPFKLLAAEDEIFRGIAKRQSLNQQAIRKAHREGLTGDARKARVVELTQNPTAAMKKRAIEDADYQTFTKKLGSAGQKMQSILDQYPVARILIPFFRTPVNILKFAGERTVLSVASKEVRATLRGEKGAIARDEQIAKIVVGSTVAGVAATLAAQGLVTGGGPKDPAERGLMRMTGWQPYSVKIGDAYYSYAGIEPMATLLGISADAVDIAERASGPEAEHIATSIAYAASTNVMSKTWLQGLSGVIEATQDPERYGSKFVSKLAGSLIPSGAAQIARVDDPVLRDARTMIDTLKSRTPGLSEDVYAVRDIFGDPILRGDSLGPDMISPIYTAKVNNDPTVKEMLSLGIFPAKPDRQIRGVELTAPQYDQYQFVAGKLLKQHLDVMVNTPGWADIPAFARKEAITKTISQSRESARSYVLMQNPDIIMQAVQAKIHDLGGNAGQ